MLLPSEYDSARPTKLMHLPGRCIVVCIWGIVQVPDVNLTEYGAPLFPHVLTALLHRFLRSHDSLAKRVFEEKTQTQTQCGYLHSTDTWLFGVSGSMDSDPQHPSHQTPPDSPWLQVKKLSKNVLVFFSLLLGVGDGCPDLNLWSEPKPFPVVNHSLLSNKKELVSSQHSH